MKRLIMIRHGESCSNAGGKATTSYDKIPLTEVGMKQAQELSERLNETPDFIYVSPFTRAQQTAEPILKKFHEVKYEIIPIYEHGYLNSDKCIGTTIETRRSMVKQYWENEDPDYCDGGDAESFRQFYQRGVDFLDKVKKTPGKLIYAVAHGLFIMLIQVLMAQQTDDVVLLKKKFNESRVAERYLKNCEYIEFQISP